jgi:hypothetical protein
VSRQQTGDRERQTADRLSYHALVFIVEVLFEAIEIKAEQSSSDVTAVLK